MLENVYRPLACCLADEMDAKSSNMLWPRVWLAFVSDVFEIFLPKRCDNSCCDVPRRRQSNLAGSQL